MESPKVISINIGVPRKGMCRDGSEMVSGIFKTPVQGRIYLTELGFEGDGVADPLHHGGEDKAVCMYSQDHYPFWVETLALELSPGAFGENLTVSGLTEKALHIGDIYRMGEAEIQCTQPRQPCFKLNKLFGTRDMVQRIQSAGYSGNYFRVLKPGWVKPGDFLVLVETHPARFSVDDANTLMHHDKSNIEGIRTILSLGPLSASWREHFQSRLDRQTQPSAPPRVEG
ncbi:MAG: MOSC domain-containing protein [Nitrospinae bacterium CG11_big_fil_rev_8_21_14_0_20_56_8]|nr:MAG: MOSC domain-containing protein [Nitrospinae bacterium CG11_big_fil_rev_8_21_14_0_20_56_8]